MLTPVHEVLLVGGMAIATFALRALPILLSDRIVLPEMGIRLLRYVPPVVLTAIVVPAVLIPDGHHLHLTWDNPRLLGAIAAILLGLWRKNLLLTISGGMVVFGLGQWLLS
jgi:branched-subunit amino acid transport protein